jgi:hypothetical protein
MIWIPFVAFHPRTDLRPFERCELDNGCRVSRDNKRGLPPPLSPSRETHLIMDSRFAFASLAGRGWLSGRFCELPRHNRSRES